MIEEISATIIGLILGIITGLLPGIHINSIIVLLFSFFENPTTPLALLVVSMSISNQFASFIPNILLGIPSENNYLSILPGHAFAKKGLALHAIRLSIIGGAAAFTATLVLIPLAGFFLLQTHEYFVKITAITLSLLLAIVALRENGFEKKLLAISIIALASACGVFLLNNRLFDNNLFVLITGFFGMPQAISALSEKNFFLKQKNFFKKIRFLRVIKNGLFGALTSFIGAVFPAVSTNEMIFIAGEVSAKKSKTSYLLLNGAVSVGSFLLSFATLFFIGKTRNASAVFVKETTALSLETLLLVLSSALFACGSAGLLTDRIAVQAVKKTRKTTYNFLNKATLAFLVLLTFFISGPFGLIALAASTAIGLIALNTGVKRTACMAFLLTPTILFYLNL